MKTPPLGAFLTFVLISIRSLSYGATGLEGGWKGTLDTGLTRFRVALVFQKDPASGWRGTFNNIDEGLYDIPLLNIQIVERSLHTELATGEIFELKLDPSGSRLEGTSREVQGHFQKPGSMASVVLVPGMDFLVPRSGPDGKPKTLYSYHPPEKNSDGWQVSDLKGMKPDLTLLSAGLQKAADGTFPHIHGVVVEQGEKLLLDEYFYGYGPEDLHPMQSVTKSVFSLLAGIASTQGLIQPEEKLYDFFPEYRSRPDWQASKEGITLHNLLTMTSGFACDDWNDSAACSWAMVDSPNWIDFCLSQSMGHEPGENFAYCGACLMPLSAILQRKSGMDGARFAQKFLFKPLGIKPYVWMEGPGGLTPPAFGLQLRPRDLAKLGELYLRGGRWKGKPILAQNWIERSLSAYVPSAKTHGKGDYGYLWWAKDMKVHERKFHVHFAWGVGGQYLFLVPELDLVCVVTAGNENDSRSGTNSFRLFESYVLPAFIQTRISNGQN